MDESQNQVRTSYRIQGFYKGKCQKYPITQQSLCKGYICSALVSVRFRAQTGNLTPTVVCSSHSSVAAEKEKKKHDINYLKMDLKINKW